MPEAPTARARELAARLRAYRGKTGWNTEQFAARLGWTADKCARIETGDRPPSHLDTTLFLAECGVPVAERGAVLELTEGDRYGCWVRPHGAGLPEDAPGVLFQYQAAREIVCYDPNGVPAVVQNTDYIEEDLRHRFRAETEDAIEKAIRRHQSTRIDLWGLLNPDTRPDAVCFLNETTLRSLPLGPVTLWHLYLDLTIKIESGMAQIRIIPADRQPAVSAGGFALLRFAAHPPVVCRPCETVTLFLEGEHVAAYERIAAELDETALSSLASRDLIVQIAGGQDAIATPPPQVVADLAQDGETFEPWFTTEAMAAVQAKQAAARDAQEAGQS
jgi:transcriptional regulator with XRE-family HTH domain